MTKATGPLVRVRRHWNCRRIGDVRLGDIDDLHWARTSGGTGHRSPFVMMYGYVLCDRLVAGTLAHSCVHGEGAHRVKIVVVKKDNPKGIIAALMAPLGPQIPRATLRLAAAGTVLPPRPKRRRARASATAQASAGRRLTGRAADHRPISTSTWAATDLDRPSRS